MSAKSRLIYVAVMLVVFSLVIAFRMTIEGVPFKVFIALCGAWLISRVHYWLRAA